jgi:DNA repair protein RecO (recombination protein O)
MPNTNALVIRTVDFSESSVITTLYTQEFGKIEALAKGGRRLKSPFESSLDILAHIYVTFLQKRGDALDLLTESKLIKRFRVNDSNLAGLYGAYYVSELVDLLTELGDANPAIFKLAVGAVDRLQQGYFVQRSLLRFEQLLLRAIGQQPSLRHCVECGESIDLLNAQRQRVAFGHLDGGVLCPNCVRGHAQVVSVSVEALRTLEMLANPKLPHEKWTHLELKRGVLGELRGLHNNYLSHLIGKKPRLHDWLKFITQKDRGSD